MNLKIYLAVSWLILIGNTVYAVSTLGINFLQYFIGDMLTNGWRMQFNIDFAIHLILFAFWVLWREGVNTKGVACTILVFFGGLFTCAYLLYCFHQANGSIKHLLLGRHA